MTVWTMIVMVKWIQTTRTAGRALETKIVKIPIYAQTMVVLAQPVFTHTTTCHATTEIRVPMEISVNWEHALEHCEMKIRIHT